VIRHAGTPSLGIALASGVGIDRERHRGQTIGHLAGCTPWKGSRRSPWGWAGVAGQRADLVFVSGIFNVLHPGHVRLLRFAKELGNKLVVGVLSDELAGNAATVSQAQRLEAIESLRVVDESFIVGDSVNAAIDRIRPDLVVKGREHRKVLNPEEEAVRKYGATLVFSSGDSFFSATDLITSDRHSMRADQINLPREYMAHHGISPKRLASLVDQMGDLHVLVLGDVIVDEYISCHPLGMSREDPTLVVTPVETRRFMGGAAIVAGHAKGLGSSASLHSVAGIDEQAEYLRRELASFGVNHLIHEDVSRPTTTKQRFRAGGKTLLRVSHLHQDAIPEQLQDKMLEAVVADFKRCDLVIFSDFNYGALPQSLVNHVTSRARESGLTMAADSQTSSQVGNIARFAGMDIITPTEYEARVATRNFDDGLVVLADQLRAVADAGIVLMTLAEDGVFIRGAERQSSATTERLPALNHNPADVAGAGDSLLVVSSMSLACGATIYEAALLGSIAAALQVSVTGNRPLSPGQLLEVISE
jgi:rfaE bifunctional protein kinase chain/domain